jgi:preprotein translocase subunit SecA
MITPALNISCEGVETPGAGKESYEVNEARGVNMLFSKKKTPSMIDLVWLTKRAKLSGILAAAQDGHSDHSGTLILAHFSQTLSELGAVLREGGIQCRVLDSPMDVHSHVSSEADSNRHVAAIALTERLTSGPGTPSNLAGPSTIRILVSERYPLEERDQAVLSFAQSCAMSNDVPFHTSLEDPLLKMFGSGNLGDLLRHMGVDETAPISQKQVTSAIKSAQRKVQKQAIADHRVRSAEEWFTYNMPR